MAVSVKGTKTNALRRARVNRKCYAKRTPICTLPEPAFSLDFEELKCRSKRLKYSASFDAAVICNKGKFGFCILIGTDSGD
jgi:hypothetical protein